MNIIESYIDKIYIINLQKDHYRRISMMHIFNKVKYTFVDGIDHTHPQWKIYLESIGTGSNPNPGIWGYYKVMISILEDAIKNNYDKIIVFEDDIILHKNFIQYFKEIISNLFKRKWSIILLGSSQDNWNFPIKPGSGYYHPNNTNGSFAMIYNKNIFKNLLKESKKMIGTFDTNALNMIYKSYYNECFVIYPNIVIADVSHSNIRPPKNIVAEAIKHHWNLADFNFNKGPYISIVFNIQSLIDLNSFFKIISTYSEQDHKYYNIIIIVNEEFRVKVEKLRSNNIDIIEINGENRIENIMNALQKDKFSDQFIYCVNNNIRFDYNHISTLLCYLYQNDCIIYPDKYIIDPKYILAELNVIQYEIEESDIERVEQSSVFMFKRGSRGSSSVRYGEIYEFVL
jgi:GR25 family glycosyltransferase involved in LPS biosynthesis